MKSLVGKIQGIWRQPLLAIEWVIAIGTIIGAFYIFTPLYPLGRSLHPTTFSLLLTHPVALAAWGSVLFTGGVLVVVGLCLRHARLRSTGWFCVFLARLYQVLAILIVAGPIPLQWLMPATLGAVVLILWAKARGEI